MSNFNRINLGTIKKNWKYLFSCKKKIGYIGWIGHDNLGDEAMYDAVKKILYKLEILPFKSTAKIKYFEKIVRKKIYDAILMGGGTLINSPGSLQHIKNAFENYKEKPVFIIGAGVKDPCYWKRIKGWQNKIDEWILYLEKCEFVGVRGPLSKRMLEDNGFTKAEITGDTALIHADDEIIKKSHRKHLGINIGIANGELWGCENDILEFAIEFARIMIDKGWRVTFLPVCGTDIDYVKTAVKEIGKNVSMFKNYYSIPETLEFLETCDLFVGEKLHSVIMACCKHTPSVMLEYRPKCVDFMESIDMAIFNMRTDQLSIEKLIYFTEELFNENEYYQKKIKSKTDEYKKLLINRMMLIAHKLYADC